MMQLGFFFGVPAYFRVCLRILGREDVDLEDLTMALHEKQDKKKLLPLFEPQFLVIRLKYACICPLSLICLLFLFIPFYAQGTNWVSGYIQDGFLHLRVSSEFSCLWCSIRMTLHSILQGGN